MRLEHAEVIEHKGLQEARHDADWKMLADQEQHRVDFFNWFFAWWNLRQQVLLRKDALAGRLLAAQVAFLHSQL